MKLKVLPLDNWMVPTEYFPIDDGFIATTKGEITPIFNRNGWYLYHSREKYCWFEVNGRAFAYHVKDFIYELSQFNYRNNPLRQAEVAALKVLHKSNLLSKHQQELLCDERQRLHIRKIQTDTSIHLIRCVKDTHDTRTSTHKQV